MPPRPCLTAVVTGRKADPVRAKKLRKTITQLGANPQHPGLHTHRYTSLDGTFGEPIWQSYVENHSPTAWRIWWFYGPTRPNHHRRHRTASLRCAVG